LPEGNGRKDLPSQADPNDPAGLDRATVWRVSATYQDLNRACFLAGISFNAMVLETEQVTDLARAPAHIEYPSAFCERADQFLFVGADLAMRNTVFSLAVTQYEGPDRRVVAFSRVFPELDAATLQLLRDIHPSQAALIEQLNQRISEVFERLKQQLYL
jgi:hypothetical protein